MCGITGFFQRNIYDNNMVDVLNKMSDAIIHRGPDTKGIWYNQQKKIYFGHRRLSILDLSTNGDQPMISSSQRYVLIFNGEIYNHREIRKDLEKYSINWKGHSDTETLIEAIEFLGLPTTLDRVVGMFAFALWDNKDNKLVLARDRLGEKPLYYGWCDQSFIFSSELKSLKKFKNFTNPISKEALNYYTMYNYIPAPLSIYEDIFKLEPGFYLEISDKNINEKIVFKKRYWNIEVSYQKNSNNLIVNKHAAINELETLLTNSIKNQMFCDVPYGSFLSGGLDSSLVTSIMQKISRNPIQTFSIGYEDKDFDESKNASKIANFLKTSHNEIIVSPKDCLDVIPKIPTIYDEPFADSSQIPTYIISKFASLKAKVILTGDGADELFGGYNRYTLTPLVWKKISWLPFEFRKLVGKFIYKIPNKFLEKIVDIFLFNFIFKKKQNHLVSKIKKMSLRLINCRNIEDFLNDLTLIWQIDDNINLHKKYTDINQHNYGFNFSTGNQITDIMFQDLNNFLPNDILCKVDRAAMSNSLETRIPFLDHEIVNFSFRIPLNMKIKDKKGKWIIRELLSKNIPKKLFDRPKSGFEIPISNWLRGPLKDWGEDLLDEKQIKEQGNFDYEKILQFWKEHQSGKQNWSPRIWSILMFQSWYKNQ